MRGNSGDGTADGVNGADLAFIKIGEEDKQAGDDAGESGAHFNKPPKDRVVTPLGTGVGLEVDFIADIT